VTELTGHNEGETGRISIGIMHFAKGLEFKAVTVMGPGSKLPGYMATLNGQSRLARLNDWSQFMSTTAAFPASRAA
jgi:superfamily I DNA/RNA helicase